MWGSSSVVVTAGASEGASDGDSATTGACEGFGAVVRDGGGAAPSGSGLMRSVQLDGAGNGRRAAVGMRGGQAWTGDHEAAAMASRKRASGAGDSGRVGIAGVIGTAGERGTSSTARDSEGAGVGGWGDEGEMGAAGSRGGRRAEGNGGNEADRDTDVWATSCCG